MLPRTLLCGLLAAATAGATGCATSSAAGGGQQPLSQADRQLARKLLEVSSTGDSELDKDQRARLVQLARQLKCPCPATSGTLAECAPERGCVQGPFAVRQIVRGLARDTADARLTERYVERYGPRPREQIELSHAPCRGPAGAPITIVAFSDFQCPYCALGRKLIDQLEKESTTELRICFKNFPLRKHAHARIAARAAFAAQQQGAFWRYHDLLFDNQNALERADLIGYAEELELDIARFERDLDSAQSRQRVSGDAAEADRLALRGTPTFFINGRLMTDPMSVATFVDWIAEERALQKKYGRSKRAPQQPEQPASAPASQPDPDRPAPESRLSELAGPERCS